MDSGTRSKNIVRLVSFTNPCLYLSFVSDGFGNTLQDLLSTVCYKQQSCDSTVERLNGRQEQRMPDIVNMKVNSGTRSKRVRHKVVEKHGSDSKLIVLVARQTT